MLASKRKVRVLEILPTELFQAEMEKTRVENRPAAACASEKETQLGDIRIRVREYR